MTTEGGPRVVRPTDPLAIALVQQKRQTGAALAELILTGLEGLIENAQGGDRMSRAVCRRIAEAGANIKAIAAVRLPDELES
jgi:hypothetical protein